MNCLICGEFLIRGAYHNCQTKFFETTSSVLDKYFNKSKNTPILISKEDAIHLPTKSGCCDGSYDSLRGTRS